MYVGELGTPAINTQAREAIDNATDEFLAGRNTLVQVAVTNDGYIIVHDAGQGIPCGPHPKLKVSTLQVIFTHIHAGGKFNDKSYKTSAGSHGVGNKCITALSTNLYVFTSWKGQWHTQHYRQGKVKTPVTRIDHQDIPPKFLQALPKPSVATKGTILAWKPDLQIIGSGAELDTQWLENYLRDVVLLTKGYKAALKTPHKTVFMQNKQGPAGYINYHALQLEAHLAHEPVIVDTPSLQVAFQQTSSDRAQINAYTNTVFNRLGGNHLKAFWDALAASLKKHASKEHSYEMADLGSGLLGYINAKLSEPAFSSQTKEKLISPVYDSIYSILFKEFNSAFNEQPQLAKQILDLATAKTASRISTQDLKAISKTIKQKRNQKSLLPGVLTQATVKPVELFCVEGASAGGHLAYARQKEFQEIIELQGKIPNVARCTLSKGIKNAAIANLLTAIGYDPSVKPFKSRIERLYILCDADADGAHIRMLVLTMLWQYVPSLIKEGRVFVVDAPLFFALHNGKEYTGHTLKELQASLPKNARCDIVRAKGWGEVEPEWVKYIALDPATRKVLRVLPPSTASETQEFKLITGDDVTARKQLLGLLPTDDANEQEQDTQ